MLHTVRYGALSFRRSDGNQIFYFIAFCSNQLILNRFCFPPPSSSSSFPCPSCRFFLLIHTVFICVRLIFSVTQWHFRRQTMRFGMKWLNSIRFFGRWILLLLLLSPNGHRFILYTLYANARTHTHSHASNLISIVEMWTSEQVSKWASEQVRNKTFYIDEIRSIRKQWPNRMLIDH